jgi:hypothetical protein
MKEVSPMTTMDIKEALSVVGNEAILITSDGWQVSVRILGARSSYGNVRFEVTGGGKTAIVDQSRIAGVVVPDDDCPVCEEMDEEEIETPTEGS